MYSTVHTTNIQSIVLTADVFNFYQQKGERKINGNEGSSQNARRQLFHTRRRRRLFMLELREARQRGEKIGRPIELAEKIFFLTKK